MSGEEGGTEAEVAQVPPASVVLGTLVNYACSQAPSRSAETQVSACPLFPGGSDVKPWAKG